MIQLMKYDLTLNESVNTSAIILQKLILWIESSTADQ